MDWSQHCATTGDEPTTIGFLVCDDTRADQRQMGGVVAARQMRAACRVDGSRINREGNMTDDRIVGGE